MKTSEYIDRTARGSVEDEVENKETCIFEILSEQKELSNEEETNETN